MHNTYTINSTASTNTTPAPWRVFLSLFLGLAALIALIPTIFGIAITLPIMTSERVYRADAWELNPELDGKLVKVHFQHIYANGQQAQDESFNLRNKGIALKRAYMQAPGKRVQYHTVHQIKECVNTAPCICAGAYELKANPAELWFHDRCFKQELVPSAEYTIPQTLHPYVEEVKDTELVLRTGDTGPAASRTVSLTFTSVPAELKGDFYLVGRQSGNTLHVMQVLLSNEEMQTHTRAAAPPDYPQFLKYTWTTILLSFGFMSFCVMCIYRLLSTKAHYCGRCALSLVFAVVAVLLALWFNFIYFLANGTVTFLVQSAWYPYGSIGVAILACWLYSRARRQRVK